MAYFECIIGGAGTTLTVTCDSVFAGKTITCTDGTTTLTAVCPSTSPYVVEFDLETDGTWTISGTISGTTHSTSITIQTSADLHEIPNGSTVTPVANIQTWLHCAGIWDKDYTTISQVLNDTTTLLALISSNNAVDYMARSTSWASTVCANSTAMTYIGNNNYCANKLLANSTWLNAICNSTYFESVLNVKVPTMTSNTTPSGVASSDSQYTSDFQPYKAFDNNDSSTFIPMYGSFTSYGTWLAYEFANTMCAKKVKVTFYENNGAWTNLHYKIQGYINNNWVDLCSEQTVAVPLRTNTTFNLVLNNNNNIKKYRLICDSLHVSGGVHTGQIATLQIYGRAS